MSDMLEEKETTDVTKHNNHVPKAKFELFMRGGTGWLYRINDHLVLKYAFDNANAHECSIYEILGAQQRVSPYILHSFFERSDAIFMPYMPGGCLALRLQGHQELETRGRCLSVLRHEPKEKVLQWAAELASAIAYPETLNFAHDDLRPANILLDGDDHVKLADFKHISRFGTDAELSALPWGYM
jgi:serine/threonine protein kinase